MIKKYTLSSLIACCSFVVITSCSAALEPPVTETAGEIDLQPEHELPDNTKEFIAKMAENHNFDAGELKTLFRSVEIKQNIIDAITRPAEGMPWFKYRKIFLTDARIDEGVKFWLKHADALAATEKQYGIPAQIIVAIIGVETMYGTRTGSYRVIDALSTLAFNYPKRSPFFTGELENFLLLCREENIDPLEPTGSYAGAMGIPQFMPSSFRNYATDFEGDQHRDIWNNPADAIASVANYFGKHHWQPGQAVAFPVQAKDESYKKIITTDLKPDLTKAQLRSLNIEPPEQLSENALAKLLAFEQEQTEELWLALDNFYVITRYNHSPLYAMAVFQLSQAIAEKNNGGNDE